MAFEEYTVASQLGSCTGLTIDVPPGTVDGDLLVALYMHVSPGITVNFPAGWTSDGFGITAGAGVGDGILEARHRIASSEPADYTWTHAGGTPDNYELGVIIRLSDAAAHIQDDNGVGTSGTLPETETTPVITPDITGGLLLYIYEAFQALDGAGGEECSYTPDPATTQIVLEKIGGNTHMHSMAVCLETSPGAARTYTYGGAFVRTLEHASGYISFVDTSIPPHNGGSSTISIPETKLALKVLPNRLNDAQLDGVA
jgi:hypothetical protein